MALDFDGNYTPRSNPPNADYPYGSFKNGALPAVATPVDEKWANDFLGFFQKLLNYAGITPSGVSDTVVASDYWNALVKRINALSQYLVDAGAANAYVVSGDPAYTTYVAGMKIRVKIANANTGDSTINVDSLGAKAIKKNVNDVLAGGDLPAGAIIEIQYDGTNFQVVAVGKHKIQIRGIYRNLVIKNNTTNPNYQMDIDIDEIILQDANGNPLRVTNVNLTNDLSTTGAGGRDGAENGGAEKSNDWYRYWVASNGTTVISFATLAATPSGLPSGYDWWAFMGEDYNDAGGDLISIYQLDKKVIRPRVAVLSDGSSASYVSIGSLAAVIPPNAKSAMGDLTCKSSIVGTSYTFLAAKNTGIGEIKLISGITTDDDNGAFFQLLLAEAQTLYYKVSNSALADVSISGWEY